MTRDELRLLDEAFKALDTVRLQAIRAKQILDRWQDDQFCPCSILIGGPVEVRYRITAGELRKIVEDSVKNAEEHVRSLGGTP